MDDDRKSSGIAGPLVIFVGLFILLPLLYILSCGPAVALMTHGYLSQDAFEIAYYPLSLAARSSHWIGDPLERYAQLWAK